MSTKMIRKNGKAASSASLLIRWPGVTLPRCQITVNGQDEAIVSWGDSVSINHGEIESYTVSEYSR